MWLPQIVLDMTRLPELSLRCSDLRELQPLSALTELETFEPDPCQWLQQLPPSDTLTALQTVSTMGTLTALQEMHLEDICGFRRCRPWTP
jgi:hypothetical protein